MVSNSKKLQARFANARKICEAVLKVASSQRVCFRTHQQKSPTVLKFKFMESTHVVSKIPNYLSPKLQAGFANARKICALRCFRTLKSPSKDREIFLCCKVQIYRVSRQYKLQVQVMEFLTCYFVVDPVPVISWLVELSCSK